MSHFKLPLGRCVAVQGGGGVVAATRVACRAAMGHVGSARPPVGRPFQHIPSYCFDHLGANGLEKNGAH